MYYKKIGVITILIFMAATMKSMSNESLSEYALGKNGSVNYWMLLMPIPNPSAVSADTRQIIAINRDFLADHGGERVVIPKMDVEIVEGLKWHPRGTNGHVNLWIYSPVKDNVTAYGFCYLYSDSDRSVLMKVGNSDHIIIYLNGQQVHSHMTERPPVFGQDSIQISLKKGYNALMVKTSQKRYEWGYMIQILSLDGNTIEGIKNVLPIKQDSIIKNNNEYPAQLSNDLPELKYMSFNKVRLGSSIEIGMRNFPSNKPVQTAIERLSSRIKSIDADKEVTIEKKSIAESDVIIDYIANVSKYDLGGWKPNIKALNTPNAYAIVNHNNQIFVFGNDELGIVYGLSFLQTRLWKDGRNLTFHLDANEYTYIPNFKQRGIYVMYGYNYSGIEVIDWGIKEWKAYIDELVLAQINYIYVYLWTDTWGYMPGTTGYNPRNRKIHETLQSMIKYAHDRGLKVCHMMAPSLLPASLYDTDRAAFSDKPFVKGWKFACTETPLAQEFMKQLIESEIKYFKDADKFQIAFFDPGGCGCDKCMRNMPSTIMNQIDLWLRIVRKFNKNAEVSISFWPFKVVEDDHKIVFAENTLELVEDKLGLNVDICEAADLNRVYLHTAKKMGFSTTAFIFPTNPETSYLLPIISGDIWKPMLKEMYAKWGFDSALFQRMEVKTRGIQDWIMGRLYWNSDLDLDELLYIYACSQTGDSESGYKFAKVIKAIDKFTNDMQEPESADKMFLGNIISNELNLISEQLPKDKKWYVDVGELYKYLGRGIYSKNMHEITVNNAWNAKYRDAKAEYIKSWKNSNVFNTAIQDENVIGNYYDNYVDYLTIGRIHTLF